MADSDLGCRGGEDEGPGGAEVRCRGKNDFLEKSRIVV